jgi:sigma-B regulation protein RsbU (phosphoserine phosphatase)
MFGRSPGPGHGAHVPPSNARGFEQYVEAAPFGILFVNEAGTITLANPSVHTCFGYSAGELLGSPVELLLPSDQRDRHVTWRGEYQKNPQPRLMAGRQLLGRQKNGASIPIAVGLNPIGAEGRRFVACTILDLTEFQRAERDMLRFFELSPDLFCIANLDGYFLRVNSNFSRVLGYTSDELRSRPFLDFVHPQDQQATRAIMARMARGLPVEWFQNRYRDARGEYHWFEWTCRPVTKEKTIFAVARDISQRIHMEQELAAREQREHTILDNTTAAVYVKGLDNRYQYVNQRFGDLFGVDRAGFVGKLDYDLFPRSMADQFSQNDGRVLESGETFSVEESFPHNDGKHTYISVKFPLLDAFGKVNALAGVSTDITVQVRAREMEREMQLAHIFQQKLYPIVDPLIPGIELAGAALPAVNVSGDYFDYMIRPGRRLVIAVGDVAGHGFGAALQMVEVRTMLRMLLRGAGFLKDATEDLNRWLCEDSGGNPFVTLLLAEIDLAQSTFQYLGAGHDALLIKANGRQKYLPSTSLALGVDLSARFAVSPILALEPADLLAIYTDGITDAANGSGERFGVPRLRGLLGRHHREPPKKLLDRLFAAAREFARGETIHDDMTAVLAKIAEPDFPDPRAPPQVDSDPLPKELSP